MKKRSYSKFKSQAPLRSVPARAENPVRKAAGTQPPRRALETKQPTKRGISHAVPSHNHHQTRKQPTKSEDVKSKKPKLGKEQRLERDRLKLAIKECLSRNSKPARASLSSFEFFEGSPLPKRVKYSQAYPVPPRESCRRSPKKASPDQSQSLRLAGASRGKPMNIRQVRKQFRKQHLEKDRLNQKKEQLDTLISEAENLGRQTSFALSSYFGNEKMSEASHCGLPIILENEQAELYKRQVEGRSSRKFMPLSKLARSYKVSYQASTHRVLTKKRSKSEARSGRTTNEIEQALAHLQQQDRKCEDLIEEAESLAARTLDLLGSENQELQAEYEEHQAVLKQLQQEVDEADHLAETTVAYISSQAQEAETSLTQIRSLSSSLLDDQIGEDRTLDDTIFPRVLRLLEVKKGPFFIRAGCPFHSEDKQAQMTSEAVADSFVVAGDEGEDHGALGEQLGKAFVKMVFSKMIRPFFFEQRILKVTNPLTILIIEEEHQCFESHLLPSNQLVSIINPSIKQQAALPAPVLRKFKAQFRHPAGNLGVDKDSWTADFAVLKLIPSYSSLAEAISLLKGLAQFLKQAAAALAKDQGSSLNINYSKLVKRYQQDSKLSLAKLLINSGGAPANLVLISTLYGEHSCQYCLARPKSSAASAENLSRGEQMKKIEELLRQISQVPYMTEK